MFGGLHARRGGAGGLRGTEYGRTVAGEGHAAVRGAAHEPAELGAELEQAAQDVGVLGGLQVVAEVGVGGEQPVLAQGAQRAGLGVCLREGGEQGQEQELEGGRNPGVQDRPHPGVRCVGFGRCGGLVCHLC